jgi:hypothetical protein
MNRKHSRATVGVLCTAALVLGWSPSAQADRDFHTTKYELSSVVDGSRHGWVVDIHTEGPTVYALERYALHDVTPGATYVMNLYAYSDVGCRDLVVALPGTATMTANAAGNARGSTSFTPAAVEGLARTTYHLRWQVTDAGGAVAYETGCVAVSLD